MTEVCLLVYFLPHVSLCGFIRYSIKYKFATNNGSGVSQKSTYFYHRNSPVNVSKRWGKLKGGSTYRWFTGTFYFKHGGSQNATLRYDTWKTLCRNKQQQRSLMLTRVGGCGVGDDRRRNLWGRTEDTHSRPQ